MKSYEKPVAVVNDEISEGVYAASGDGSGNSECWDIKVKSDQKWNGAYHTFRVTIVHSKDYQHISTSTTATVTFNNTITEAKAQEYGCSVSGNKVVIQRDKHANGYGSGDTADYLLEVKAADEATTKNLAVTNATIWCEKAPNVQGGFD